MLQIITICETGKYWSAQSTCQSTYESTDESTNESTDGKFYRFSSLLSVRSTNESTDDPSRLMSRLMRKILVLLGLDLFGLFLFNQNCLDMFTVMACFYVNEESPRISNIRNLCLFCISIGEMTYGHEFSFAHRDMCEICVYASFHILHFVYVLGNYYV